MRISDWSSDVCSSDLARTDDGLHGFVCAQTWYRDSRAQVAIADSGIGIRSSLTESLDLAKRLAKQNACELATEYGISSKLGRGHAGYGLTLARDLARSEEHTSELQSLMRISYAVFCLKKKNTQHKSRRSHIDTQTHH